MNKNIRLLVESFFDDEIFNISHDIKLDIEDIGDQYYRYRYFPKDFKELRTLLEQLLKKRGKDADLNDIDVSNITSFYDLENNLGLFEDLDPHNIKIERWNVSNVENMRYMFYDCGNFNSDLSNWNVSKVTDMYSMFDGCENFNSDLSNWKVNKVKNMKYMFRDCENFNSDLSNWKVNKVENMRYMFRDCENFESDLSKWDVSNVDVDDMFCMFDDCKKLKKPQWYKKIK